MLKYFEDNYCSEYWPLTPNCDAELRILAEEISFADHKYSFYKENFSYKSARPRKKW